MPSPVASTSPHGQDFAPAPFVVPVDAPAASVDVAETPADVDAHAAHLAQLQAAAAQQSATQLQLRIAAAQTAAARLELSEAETRALIDIQLREAGWEVDSARLRHGLGARPIKGRNRAIAECCATTASPTTSTSPS